MKTQLKQWILCLLLSCCGLISCSDDDEIQPVLLDVSTEAVMFTENASTKKVVVTTEQEWSAEVESDWCSVSQIDNELEITVTANTEVETRTTVLTIRSQGQVKQITVKQAGVEPQILFALDGEQEGVDLLDKSLNINGDVTACHLKILATVDYEVILEEYADWVEVATGVRAAEKETTLSFELQPNETGKTRQTEILLKQVGGDYYTYLSIVQQAQ